MSPGGELRVKKSLGSFFEHWLLDDIESAGLDKVNIFRLKRGDFVVDSGDLVALNEADVFVLNLVIDTLHNWIIAALEIFQLRPALKFK